MVAAHLNVKGLGKRGAIADQSPGNTAAPRQQLQLANALGMTGI
jgi:hypothetical protein